MNLPDKSNISLVAEDKNQILHPVSVKNDEIVLSLAAIYTILFFIGIFGNFSVLMVIWKLRQILFNSPENGILYVFSLCLVDFIVMLSMPLLIIQILMGHWILGTPLCTIYWTLESGGKVISGLILTALSFDRFVGVCYPMCTNLRSKPFTICLLLSLMVVALALLLPLPLHAKVERTVLPHEHFVYGYPAQFVQLQCSTHSMPEFLFMSFTIYMFIFGFCLPAISITVFYSLMICKLRRHTRRMSQSSIPLRKIGIYTFAISTFYFICWLPYWGGTLFLICGTGVNKTGNIFVYTMYLVHALPYLNSALNWVFYAILNTQFTETSNCRGRATCSSCANGINPQLRVNRRHQSLVGLNNIGGSQQPLQMQSVRVPMVTEPQGSQLENDTVV